MRAILHGGKFRIINMKKIIAIFSVILTFGLGLPNDGWGVHACPDKLGSDDGDANHDLIIGESIDSDSPRYLCQSSDGCRKGVYVVVVGKYYIDKDDGLNSTTNASEFDLKYAIGKVCDDPANDYKWRDEKGAYSDYEFFYESGHQIRVDNSELKAKKNGSFLSYEATCDSADTGCAIRIVDGATVGWYCKDGYTKDTSSGECISDSAAQDERNCTDSGGSWSGSECQCSDGNGLVQSSDKKTCICKTDGGYSWVRDPSDSKKCIDPGSACNTSGGHWVGTTCDCSALAPEKTSDGTQCVDDSFFQPCEDSGGQWNGTECTNCDASRGLTPAPGNKTCKCINSNEEYSSTTDRCVLTEQALCEKTGGVWDGTNCDCDVSGKNIKKKDGSVPVQCECISPDYEWNADKTQGCKLSPEAENRKENFEKSKEACEAWGGTWSPGTWESPDGVDVTKWKCKCPNRAGVVQATAVSCKCDIIKGYQETAPNTCTQTTCADLQTKCNAVRDASYKTLTAHDGQKYCECVCDDEKNKAYNYSKNKCEAITNICDLIDDAVLDRYGNCVCKSNWLPPVRGKCPSGTSSGSASGGGASSGVTVSPQQIAQAKQNVSDVYDDLKSISDGFGRSHWKTASGNFNGARLASDSIAGVVLGTVGGVVTSNVIKKNQVKGGFESLQCTVGGQLVADFADQFQVGIR